MTIASFLDELEKIGASKQIAGYMQLRSGTRPYRVSTLLNKSDSSITEPISITQNPGDERPDPAVPDDDFDKAATFNKSEIKERSLEGFAKARPYVASAFKAAIPAALVGKFMAGEGSRGSKAARIGAITGAGLGIVNKALEDWAQKHKRKAVAKKILNAGG